MAAPSLSEGHNMLRSLIQSLGRDDIAVTDVSEEDGNIRFALTRAGHRHEAVMPLDVLADRSRALPAMMAILPKLSKSIEREHLEKAKAGGTIGPRTGTEAPEGLVRTESGEVVHESQVLEHARPGEGTDRTQ